MSTKTDLMSSIKQHLGIKTIFDRSSSYKRNVNAVAIMQETLSLMYR